MRATDVCSRTVQKLEAYLESIGIVDADDAEIVVALFRTLTTQIEVNNALREHPALVSQLAWYVLKYRGLSEAAVQRYKSEYNAVYLERRSRGYDEWASKAYAEQATHLVAESRDRHKSFSDYLSSLYSSCEQRLRSLESLSHNIRSERR